ncbi:YihY/virulence factor BrkB family protein [Sporosarcina pasteurii]|uniref:YihY family inner membrane protein n=2 Tax=Sporosarcina pasteurii TaxID=1474 RepID=A0A380CAX9_SPOPA|nr:YihY/virulence factor BrkB family protein [Sporosarcina pasteurii]MDS9473340.1 YihY/virulence factor BrkB family protein [Sporosarcina pasteurii]SUJ16732.1 YihY family inner membrane protein [Sporosarcina pasteurii]
MERDVSTTPKTKKKSASSQLKHKEHVKNQKAKFMNDSAVGRFLNDVKDGELDQFDVTTLNGFMKELLTRIKKVDVTGLASQLAFFFLLSLFPLLIFMITLLPYLNLDQSEIFLFIRDYAPVSVATLIEKTLGEILNNRNGGLLSFGILATIWSASKGMNALTKALNRSYFQEESRSFIIARGMSVVFTIMLIAVLVVALVLPVFGRQIGVFAFSYLGLEAGFLKLWTSLRWVIPPILIYFVFSLIYWIVPNLKLHYKSVILGSAFSTIGWIVTTLGFSFYVGSYGNYSTTYGSIGTIIVLMMWLYLSAIILMLGGQINAVMSERKQALNAKEKSKAIV